MTCTSSSPSKAPVVPRIVLVSDVMPLVAESILTLIDGSPGQSTRGLLDIALGIMADAERKKLEQLTGEVFVGFPLPVRRGVEPDKKRRVA